MEKLKQANKGIYANPNGRLSDRNPVGTGRLTAKIPNVVVRHLC